MGCSQGWCSVRRRERTIGVIGRLVRRGPEVANLPRSAMLLWYRDPIAPHLTVKRVHRPGKGDLAAMTVDVPTECAPAAVVELLLGQSSVGGRGGTHRFSIAQGWLDIIGRTSDAAGPARNWRYG